MHNLKYCYKQFFGLARSHWRDMKQSGLDVVARSKRRAFEVAAERTGFPADLCARLYNRCFQEYWSFDLCAYVDPLDPDARMLELSGLMEGTLSKECDHV